MDAIARAYEATVDDVSAAQRTVTAVINTAAVDRFRTVIDPAGIDLEGYRKNPVVLWEHGKDPTRGRLPIGRNLWINRGNNKLVARTEFARDDYSQTLFELYRDGALRGWSIFAIPNEKASGKPTRAEIAARSELAECETIYRACELGEYSAVAVPGNAETLTLMTARGIWVPDEARGIVMQPGGGMVPVGQSAESDDDAEEDDDTETRYLKKVGEQWGVFAEDGKLLGKHPTRAEAARQLAADTAHKHDDPERTAPELPPTSWGSYKDIDAHWLGELQVMRSSLHVYLRDLVDLGRGRI